MAARDGDNLLEGALRIANAPGRSHPVRLKALLQHLTLVHDFPLAALFLPAERERVLSERLTSTQPYESFTPCALPFGSGSAGRSADLKSVVYAPLGQLHPAEPTTDQARYYVSFPVLQEDRLAAILSVAAQSNPLPLEVSRDLELLLPLVALLLSDLRREKGLQLKQRNRLLIEELIQLLHVPFDPGKILPRLIKLCNSSGISECLLVRLWEGQSGASRLFNGYTNGVREELSELLKLEEELSAQVRSRGCEAESASSSGVRALCLPLNFEERSLGTVTFCGDHSWEDDEQKALGRSLARLLSRAVAEAISSDKITSFFTEKDKKLKELSLLYRMSNTMLSTIKLNKLIHLTLTALTSGPTPFFDRAMLFLTNERSGVLLGMLGVTTETAPHLPSSIKGDDLLTSRWDISEEEMTRQRASEFSKQVMTSRLELNQSLNVASRAVLEKRLIFVSEPEQEPVDSLRSNGSPFAVAPLIAHGQAVGAVIVDNALSRTHMTQEDLRFLQLFTNQAGMAIENSMLYNRIEDANRQLFEAQEHLMQKERLAAIGEAATGIAHELKGPLVAIGGFANRLTKKLSPETTEWEHAELIVREVLRLESILSEILLYAKKATICYHSCNVVDVVKESLAVVSPSLEERQIEVKTHFEAANYQLLGDGQQLKQVFMNLFLNAMDAMAQGGRLGVDVGPFDLEGTPAVCVKIADSGGGIPLEAMKSIFTPFYTTKESGTGLGLPIANRIVANHGGKILLTNHPGEGAEFKVVLPVSS